MKKIIIAAVAIAALAGSAALLLLPKAYVLPVLMYHSIDDRDKETKLSVSPKSFAAQMEFLHKNGYNVVTLEKMASYIRNREKAPPKTVAITIDDGLYNNYEHAYPALKKYNMPATFFIISDKIGEEGYLGRDEIREMADSGIVTIGSHTVSHKWLPAMGTKRLKAELADSKAELEKLTGRPVNTLCYPVGAHNERVKKEAALAGYSCAVATNPGPLAPNDDVYSIKRIRISRTSDNPLVFWFETSGYYTWLKEHRDS